MVTQQSQEEIIKVFTENKKLHQVGQGGEAKLIVVSISVQPILSLAIRYNLTPDQCARRLAGYLKQLGADYVVDMTVADELALVEARKEFIRRYRSAESDGIKNALPMLASSCPGMLKVNLV